jgi:hypothetical protein
MRNNGDSFWHWKRRNGEVFWKWHEMQESPRRPFGVGERRLKEEIGIRQEQGSEGRGLAEKRKRARMKP